MGKATGSKKFFLVRCPDLFECEDGLRYVGILSVKTPGPGDVNSAYRCPKMVEKQFYANENGVEGNNQAAPLGCVTRSSASYTPVDESLRVTSRHLSGSSFETFFCYSPRSRTAGASRGRLQECCSHLTCCLVCRQVRL
ncbi:hypothetical protein TNCV_817071 [Trichonephila clavipes]|nr:hypothetical protein TNCV_817071 [Trichonephila clavipes]